MYPWLCDSFSDSENENSKVVTKSVFHPGPCDAHVAAFFFFLLQFIYIFHSSFPVKTAVFDVSESLDAMQTN